MGIGIILYLFEYFCIMVVMGVVILKRTPGRRLTIANLGVFVLGATGGMFALTNFVLRTFDVYRYIPLSKEAEIVDLLSVIGMLVGGVLALWIKFKVFDRHR